MPSQLSPAAAAAGVARPSAGNAAADELPACFPRRPGNSAPRVPWCYKPPATTPSPSGKLDAYLRTERFSTYDQEPCATGLNEVGAVDEANLACFQALMIVQRSAPVIIIIVPSSSPDMCKRNMTFQLADRRRLHSMTSAATGRWSLCVQYIDSVMLSASCRAARRRKMRPHQRGCGVDEPTTPKKPDGRATGEEGALDVGRAEDVRQSFQRGCSARRWWSP